MQKRDLKNLQKTVMAVIKPLSSRNRDIISRRFGLANGKRETLESIGQSYSITRERVRQIEESTLVQLTKVVADHKEINRTIAAVQDILIREGGVMRERDLFVAFSGSEKYDASNAALSFVLTLNHNIVKSDENDRFHAFWATDRKKADSLRSMVGALAQAFQDRSTVVSENELYTFARSSGALGGNGTEVSSRQLTTLMRVSKDLAQNIFNEIGLSTWSEVKPKGVRDKAYLIMKKEGSPRHFVNIAKLINTARFDAKSVNVQTVHNELIKDNRFILVGRGIYALSEWGYKPGTVKDVLVDILKQSSRPLTKTDIITRVMSARMVKENTILLNLQDSSQFVRNEDGTYALRKA